MAELWYNIYTTTSKGFNNMGTIKAVLVGVCEYPTLKAPSLPFCKNDLYATKDALQSGLCVAKENILLCGENGTVTINEMLNTIKTVLSTANPDDILIFYFSGHGGKNCLALSDGKVNLQSLVDLIEQVPLKSKIAILDSCHSGSFELTTIPKLDIHETVEYFVGRGFAVMASCSAEETSGFHPEKDISLYTSFLCDALTSQYLIKQGRKSLEDISEAVFHFANLFNKKGIRAPQNPIFRSSIGGTIFFEVEEYNPYKIAKIYEETDKYIIYQVNPVHHATAKRLAVKVILRYHSSMEEIAEFSKEICKKALYYEVHQNAIAESHHRGNPANIIWCHFGYDESDMINGSFVCYTTWVDDKQDKEWWYRETKNSCVVNDVYIISNSSYNALKLLQKDLTSKEELIKTTREYTSNIITLAQQHIKEFREFLNGVITEEQLIDTLQPLIRQMNKYFILQSNLPISPVDLHDWSDAHTNLAGAAIDLSLYYDKNNLATWSTENRKWLMSDAIKKYELALEKLKIEDVL